MIIDVLRQEHRNIERLLLVLEHAAACKALQPQDWAEIASSRSTDHQDPLFSETVEERFDAVRRLILQLEQEAEAERVQRKAGAK
jgi:hemerythrin-like domain-containing protein